MPTTTSTWRRKAAAVATAVVAFTGTLAAVAATPAGAWAGPENRMAYVATADGISEVFSMRPDGTGRTQLTFGGTDRPGGGATKKCDPAFSPNGKEIAYAGNDGGIYVMDAERESDLNVPERLNDVDGWQMHMSRRPTWSADGLSVVVHIGLTGRDPAVTEHTYDLYRFTRSSLTEPFGPMEAITSLAPGDMALHARYSPDGQHLAYSYKPKSATTYELRIMPLPAAGATLAAGPPGNRVTTTGAALLASWNSSGTSIAYVSTCSGTIYTMPVKLSTTTGTWSSGASRKIATGGGCGASYSSYDDNLFTYADAGRIYVRDLSRLKAKPANLGTGAMPGW